MPMVWSIKETLIRNRGWQSSSGMGRGGTYFRHRRPKSAVVSRKQSPATHKLNKCGCVPVKLYFQKQVESQI